MRKSDAPCSPICRPFPLCHPRRLSPPVILAFSPPVILAFSPPVIVAFSPPVILDISNRGSSVVVFSSSVKRKTLDSCFRRNDSFGVSLGFFLSMTEERDMPE